MGVQASGLSSFSFARVRAAALALGVVFAVVFYLYGPALTPVMQAAAHQACNEATGGSYRHYHVQWTAGTRPHWICFDTERPAERPMNLGWWVSP